MVNLNRREFAKRSALVIAVASIGGTAFKCGSEQVSIYVRTITTFLNQIAGLLPAHEAVIAKIVKVASDFDAAYRKGDFASADSFFNSLTQNLTSLEEDIGIDPNNTVKSWIAVIGATVTSIAVLLKEQVTTQPRQVTAQLRIKAKSAGAVERLASQAAVDALYQAARITKP